MTSSQAGRSHAADGRTATGTSAELSPSYREAVLWQEQAELPELPATALPRSTDCVVVGAGYAGLSCARELARAGRSVVVLDAHAVGWGASSRNGGMVIPELKAGPAALERAHGPLGRRLYAEVSEAFDHVEALIAGESLDCDYHRSGQLYLAHAERVVPSLRAMAREHGDELGEPVRFVPREALGEEVGSTVYAAGLVIERTGGLHPAWGGNVAITLDRLPHVGRIDGAWYATGCNGSGVALNTWLGARIARHLLGEAPPPSFAELTHRPIPLHRARAAYLPLVGLWFRWQDRGFK